MVLSKCDHLTDSLAPFPGVQKICSTTSISFCGSAIGNSGAAAALFAILIPNCIGVLRIFSGFAGRLLGGRLVVLLSDKDFLWGGFILLLFGGVKEIV
jgi:hypothetical protein